METIKLIGGFLLIFGCFGLIITLIKSWVDGIDKTLKENKMDVCPSCQEEVVIGNVLCPACDAFISNLEHCEKHDFVYEGSECPKCKYGDFGQIRR